MRVHRDVEFVQLKVRVPRDVKDGFLAVCKKHHATACHVIYVLMKATVKGDEVGVLDLSMKNPFIVQMQHYFPARPRGHGKYDVAEMGTIVPSDPRVYCAFCGGFSGGLVFCQRYGSDWLPSSRCEGCPSNWFKKKGEG
jgi:hypothetical protein